ncbi:MAG: (deoxy)nucleoside triphosphate pyrophosphohydrolase [Spirochaetales bacterium]|nr:MAG: (deoxy)nucleoside triphosphate pyrophosphohydrolase [Spirochaetales bacterium]
MKAERIQVTAAVIAEGGRVLLAQRSAGDPLEGKWEFPGGKIEEGESPEECLKRELKEELGIGTRIGKFIASCRWDYPHISIELLAYEAEILSGSPAPLDHSACAWVNTEELAAWELAPADVPIAEKVRLLFS